MDIHNQMDRFRETQKFDPYWTLRRVPCTTNNKRHNSMFFFFANRIGEHTHLHVTPTPYAASRLVSHKTSCTEGSLPPAPGEPLCSSRDVAKAFAAEHANRLLHSRGAPWVHCWLCHSPRTIERPSSPGTTFSRLRLR